MRIRAWLSSPLCLVLALVGCGAVACGGGGAEPETPATQGGEESKDAPKPEAEKPAEPEPAPEEPEEKAAPKEDAKAILIREGTAFLLDHKSSDMGVKAEEQCKKKSGDDVAKQANCVSKALGKMPREGILFDEDDAGKWWYVRFGIEKNVKIEYNRVQVEVGEPQGSKIKLTTTGKDVAKRKKGSVPKELDFEVPDEYTIILHDPDRGRLEFEPKLGLFEEGQ